MHWNEWIIIQNLKSAFVKDSGNIYIPVRDLFTTLNAIKVVFFKDESIKHFMKILREVIQKKQKEFYRFVCEKDEKV